MKIFFTLALTVMALSIANAQTPTTKETAMTVKVKVADQADMKNEKITPTATPIAIGAPDVSQNFVGTNDLNLLLLRRIIKA